MEPEVLETDNNTVDPLTLPVEDLIHYEEELNELQNLSKTADNLSDIIQEGNEVGEEVYEKIEEAKKTLEEKADDIDPLDVVITQESIRTFRKRLGMEEQPLNFNFEDATSNPSLAMAMNIEGLKEIGKTVLEDIQKAWEKLIEFFKGIFKKLKTLIFTREAYVASLKADLDDAKKKPKRKERIKEAMRKMRDLNKGFQALEDAAKGLDNDEDHVLYKTLYDLYSFDILGYKEYIPALNTLITDIPNILNGLANVVDKDLTRRKLGEYLEKAFTKEIDAFRNINAYDTIKDYIKDAMPDKKSSFSKLCLITPKGPNTYTILALKVNDRDAYGITNPSTITINEPIVSLIDGDKLPENTSEIMNRINTKAIERALDTVNSYAEKIAKKVNYLKMDGLASDEQVAANKQIMSVVSALFNAVQDAGNLYRKLVKRMEAISKLA